MPRERGTKSALQIIRLIPTATRKVKKKLTLVVLLWGSGSGPWVVGGVRGVFLSADVVFAAVCSGHGERRPSHWNLCQTSYPARRGALLRLQVESLGFL